MTDEQQEKIYPAMIAAMKTMEWAEKTGEISGYGGYKFSSELDVINAVRNVLLENGVHIHVQKMKVLDFQHLTIKRWDENRGREKESTRMHGQVHVRYAFVHEEDGSFFTTEALGEAMDNGDKTLNKCMTIALKYALIQNCLLPRGDDPDKVGSAEHEGEQVEKPKRARKKPAAKKATTKKAVAKKEAEQPASLVEQAKDLPDVAPLDTGADSLNNHLGGNANRQERRLKTSREKFPDLYTEWGSELRDAGASTKIGTELIDEARRAGLVYDRKAKVFNWKAGSDE